MRRLVTPARRLLLCSIIGLGSAGCSNFRELFSAHADVAAEAGGQELSADRLAEIVVSPKKGVRVNRETVDFVANAWVDYTLFGQAAARGQLPTDSASVAAALWPEIFELKGSHWHDTLMARRGTVAPAAVDSVYNTTDVRVLQHILFVARANADSAARKAAYAKAEGTLKKIRGGANFGALALQLSEDPGSKADSGYLPPSPHGRFVVPFDSAGWKLEPGQVSGIVKTDYGYHIIKRPALADVRERVSQFVANRAGARLDSIYMDSLAILNKLDISSSAPREMRAASLSPEDARNSKKVLVHFKGGGLTLGDYVRWIRALPPQYSTQLKTANDDMMKRFARILSQNVLLLRQADSAGIGLTGEEWQNISTEYRANLDTLTAMMGLERSVDSSVALGDRLRVANLKVDRYFDDLVSGKTRLRPLPSALATILRERSPYKVYAAGVNRATEIATAKKAAKDSTSPGEGAMQRAPGGPPIPGMNGGVSPGAAPGGSAPAATPGTDQAGQQPAAKQPAASQPAE
jgi:hypothetical protein